MSENSIEGWAYGEYWHGDKDDKINVQTEKLRRILSALDATKHALADVRSRLPLGSDAMNMANDVILEAEKVLAEVKP